ncbi:calpain-1 catalytic subunit-like [Pseudoliparis swirei]|uniref:calpain-1 catalytic subunit-like n=1 Tax=Pseudoliparis swirei TaxID=2059687 RepID=UPI0024BE38C5|nr:calpain-1 catalytic subunit-like [Pseudoliparis swirei]
MPESGNCTSIINLRYQDGSEGSPSNPAKFNNQDYAQLKDNNLRRRRLFVDNTFPPNNQSLGDLEGLTRRQEAQVEWLRPADILKAENSSSDPVFCTKGASRFDFDQGVVGNCWFLAAISALTFKKSLFGQVVSLDQSFSDYAGVFHFRFWRFGKWVDVVIDDLLPTLNNKPLSVRSKIGNEFWAPLLEKAYAKVCGSYADMSVGLPSEACKDFSGGLTMNFELHEAHKVDHDVALWNALTRATKCHSMICCGTPQKGGKLVNTVKETGIVDAHAYSVTAVTEVNYYSSIVKLVQLMNPWGQTEWNGKWSDKSGLWKSVSPEDRAKCSDRNDGEFWMELEDFCYYFQTLFISCENPNFIDGDVTCQWKSMTYDGSWVAGRSAGGNVFDSTFATNPQYRLQVSNINKEEQQDQNIFLSLMQKPQQKSRKRIRSHPIGLTVFKIPPGTPEGRVGSSFFQRNSPMKQRQLYTHERDLIESHSLEPGEYLIMPSTMKPYMSADFVLTVYTKTDAKMSVHDDFDDDEHDHEEEENLILPEVPTDNGDADDDVKEETTGRRATRAMFSRYADQSGQLKARQLQKLLNDNFPHGTWYGFGLDTCMSMMAMVDTDQRRTMAFNEFSTLWGKINKYKKSFHRADVNGGGTLSEYELQKAIEAADMDMDDIMVKLMMARYSGASNISMESFITLMLRLEKMSDVFKNKSSDGVIHFSWTEWSNVFMYN